jgi:hypothetical protein
VSMQCLLSSFASRVALGVQLKRGAVASQHTLHTSARQKRRKKFIKSNYVLTTLH